ncbi:SgcJ/EcaC family oxidoreductase [Kribbella deserti]|uniref:SgcJ/EcaC family oxidoreductase n=1 Tax=Kribbella deserti TaxID=1926257 RepID=A0ABV6QXV5_9ACTN
MDIKVAGEVPNVSDIDSIAKFVASVGDIQAREDAEGFIALFRDDAKWVTGHGKRLYGKQAIADFTRKVMPGATKDSYATYEVDHILFITADLALATINQEYHQRDAEPGAEPDRGSPGYLLARNGDSWLIAAGQNTVVVPE